MGVSAADHVRQTENQVTEGRREMSILCRNKFAFFAVACLTASSTAWAAEEGGAFSPKNFTSTFGITSDYVFRGISQTDSNWAAQGSFDYAHPVGLYLGVWGSNVSFGGNVEVDGYAGYRGEIAGINYDVGGVYYMYPKSRDDAEFNYFEVSAKASYTLKLTPVEPTIGVSYYFSPDFFGEDGTAHYINGKLSLGLPWGLGVAGEVGYQNVKGDETTGHGNGLHGHDGFEYVHYRFGVSKSDLLGFNLDLSYHNTNESKFLGKSIADDRVVFTASRTF